MDDMKLIGLAQELEIEDLRKLIPTWINFNKKKLTADISIDLSELFHNFLAAGLAEEVQKWKEHANAGETAGAEALMRCRDIALLERAKHHVDKFKGRSFNNYENWFYARIEKLKKAKK